MNIDRWIRVLLHVHKDRYESVKPHVGRWPKLVSFFIAWLAIILPLAACLGSTTGAGIIATASSVPKNTQTSSTSAEQIERRITTPSLQLEATEKSNAESEPIVRVVQMVRPAVVNITTQQIAYDFYLRPVPTESGTGSGVIFDPSGLILTNNHVVENAQGLNVTLPDGRSFDGRIVGTDPRSDLAVVKIDGSDLPTAQLGDSDALQIGQTVIAIGNALALPGGPTVTSGIVGALGRSIREPNGAVLYDLIQTDAAINPGNSGGPLIDLQGRVVGINTAIAADAPGGGIGFAIAINAARPIAQQLITQGRVIRPWLGVTLQNVTPSLAARYNLPVSKGALIYSVQRNTPAARAGLRRGDIIIRFGDEEVQDDVSLLKALSKRRVGETVTLVIVRDSERLSVNVTLEEMPASAQ